MTTPVRAASDARNSADRHSHLSGCGASVRTGVLRLYVAGPMTGLPEFNYPAFIEAEAQLQAAGFHAESPHRNGGGDTSKPWRWYMRAALLQLLSCEGVALLPGWEKSRGARLEAHVAETLGMDCRPIAAWLPCDLCHGHPKDIQVPNRFDPDYSDDVPGICPDCGRSSE